MIAVFVIAIGLLGVAALHATSLRSTSDSGNRSEAVRLTYDMADRLRQDPNNLAAILAIGTTNGRAADSTTCYTGAGCTGAVSAASQFGEWQRQLTLRVPGGQGVVCRDASPLDGTGEGAPACTGLAGDPVVVKVWWNVRNIERQTSGNGTSTLQYVTVVGF